MIRKVSIENYKSIQKLDIELGRFNVFIGENGSGKSNILEAITLGGAAATNKLDNDFLERKGIRRTDSIFMRSAFSANNHQSNINLLFEDNNHPAFQFSLSNKNDSYAKWELSNESRMLVEQFSSIFHNSALASFITYSPQENNLREFKELGHIEPLGIQGEGLYKLLSVIAKDENPKFQEIKDNLSIIDWFENFQLGKRLFESERFLEIRDKYIAAELSYFDQRSSNEGFLFLLFYFALFISEYTPIFFAIENIETALNPKLCRKLMTILNDLSIKYGKQVIFTTHNPSVLDGINIHDNEQRLFVIEKNHKGHTLHRRIKFKEGKSIDINLSQAFMNGYLGGLPSNF